MSARPRVLRSTLLAALALVAFGCSSGGGGDDGGTGPAGGALDDVAPTTTTPAALDRVELTGLPLARRAVTDYEVVAVGFDTIWPLPVEVDDEGTYFFFAPFHPVTPTTGGELTFQVRDGDASSPEFTLELAALEDAPGAFVDLTAALRRHVDAFAQRSGTSLEALQALDFAATPVELLPLRYAVSWIDDPANPNSFGAIARGGTDYLDEEELRLLEQITSYMGLEELLDVELAALDEFEGPPALVFDPGLARRDCLFDAGVQIGNADQLSAAMWEAKFADIAVRGRASEKIPLIANTFAAGSTIPLYGKAFTVAGATFSAWVANKAARAGLLPSEFVSISANVSKPRFNEDSEETGSWSNVQVTAQSRGWAADQAIAEGIIALAGARLTAGQGAQVSSAEFAQSAAAAAANPVASNFIGQQDEGLIDFCPQQWTVDISSAAWCEARSVFGYFEVASGAQTYRPLEAEEDFLSISARPDKFGQETIDQDFPIGVDPIVVNATPSEIVLETPGETVTITASLQYADDEKLFWDPGAGTWDDGLLQITNEAGTRPLKTPSDRGAYPFVVTIESFSRKGLRASGTPVRETFVTIRVDEPITVTPANACVENGESESFQALQDEEPADVTWSLESPAGGPSSLGTISSAGVYTAPSNGTGSAIVVATSNDDPNNRGQARVDVGTCSCFWALSIQGGGAWSGTFAGHGFPSSFGFFSLSFDTPSGNGLGNAQSFTDAPTEDAVGTFTIDTFGFQIGDRSWVSSADPDDGTSAVLTIVENDGDSVQGSISGTVVRFANGQETFSSFDLNFRSGNLGSPGSICGDQ